MPKNISFIVTNSGTINAVANGKAYTVPRDHANYPAIKEALVNDDATKFDQLVNVARAVENFTAPAANSGVGTVTVKDGTVYWNNEPMHNALTDRILSLMRDGFPFDPMLRFLENLMLNPSYRAVNELYNFLDRQGLPITEDGCFLGYKRVREDYTDCYSGKFLNTVGSVVEMPRNNADDNWREACSSGFHVGSIEYVRTFNSGKPVVVVKVNPKDVVSVPGYDVTKLRTCKYEVVAEYDRNLIDALKDTLYSSTGSPVPPPPVADFPRPEDDDGDDDYDSDLEDDSDDDEDDEESELDRLTDKANEKNADPVRLAWELDVEKHRLFLSRTPTVREVLEEALNDHDEDYIADKINGL